MSDHKRLMEEKNDLAREVVKSRTRINELSLIVHRLCKMVEDNLIEGKPLDIKKVEEARNYIIRNANIKDALR